MTYNEKKSLYESIMKDIAKIVKRQINESNDYRKVDDSDELELHIKRVLKGNSKPLYIVTDNQAKVRRIIKSVSGSDYTEINCSKYRTRTKKIIFVAISEFYEFKT